MEVCTNRFLSKAAKAVIAREPGFLSRNPVTWPWPTCRKSATRPRGTIFRLRRASGEASYCHSAQQWTRLTQPMTCHGHFQREKPRKLQDQSKSREKQKWRWQVNGSEAEAGSPERERGAELWVWHHHRKKEPKVPSLRGSLFLPLVPPQGSRPPRGATVELPGWCGLLVAVYLHHPKRVSSASTGILPHTV